MSKKNYFIYLGLCGLTLMVIMLLYVFQNKDINKENKLQTNTVFNNKQNTQGDEIQKLLKEIKILQARNQEHIQIANKYQALEKQIQEHQTQLTQNEEIKNRLTQEKEALEQQIATADNRNQLEQKQKQKEINDKQKAIDDLKQETEQAKNENNQQNETKLQALKTQLEQKQQEINVQKEKLTQETTELNNKLTELQNQKKIQDTQNIVSQEERITKINNKISQLKQAMNYNSANQQLMLKILSQDIQDQQKHKCTLFQTFLNTQFKNFEFQLQQLEAELTNLQTEQIPNTPPFKKQVSWDSVFGMEPIKKELKDLEARFKSDNILNIENNPMPCYLLYGPPGTGKTFVLKTLCDIVGDVHFIKFTPGDLDAPLVGQGQERLKNILEEAKKHQKTLIFIDELSGFANRENTQNTNQTARNIVNKILQEMPVLTQDKDSKIAFVGACNHIDQIDSAFLDRWDKKIEVPTLQNNEIEPFLKFLITQNQLISFQAFTYLTDIAKQCQDKEYSQRTLNKIIQDAYNKVNTYILEEPLKHDVMLPSDLDEAFYQTEDTYYTKEIANLKKDKENNENKHESIFTGRTPTITKSQFLQNLQTKIDNMQQKKSENQNKYNNRQSRRKASEDEYWQFKKGLMKHLGFSFQQCWYDLHFSLRDMYVAGFTARELKNHGFSKCKFKEAGYTAKELKDAGFTAEELKYAGYTTKELKEAGYITKELKEEGFTVKELQEAGFTVKNFKDGGYTARNLRHAGYKIQELKNAGYTIQELKDAEFPYKYFKDAGYTIQELKDAGWVSGLLIDAGFTAKELKNAGYTLKDFKYSNYKAKDYKDAGYTLKELKEAGYSAWLSKTTGFTIQELKNAGYTIQELTDAGF